MAELQALATYLAAGSGSHCAYFQFLSYPSSLANIPCYTDPFAEADEDTGETKQSQNYIHIRIQREFTFKTQHMVARHSPRCDATR